MSEHSTKTRPPKAEMLRAWGHGISVETVASIYGVPVAEVKEITRSALADAPYSTADPEVALNEHLFRLDALIEQLAGIAPKEKGAVRVRAVDTRFRALRHRFEVLQATGVVPADVSAWSAMLNVNRWTEELLSILEEHDVLTESVKRSIIAHSGRQLEEWEMGADE